MRTLKRFPIALGVFSVFIAPARSTELASTSGYQNAGSNLTADSLGRLPSSSVFTQNFRLSDLKLRDEIGSEFEVSSQSGDAARFGFLDRQQRPIFATGTSDTALQAKARISLNRGAWSLSVHGRLPLNGSILRERGFGFDAGYSLYQQSTRFEISYQRQRVSRPESSYLDWDFIVKDRPVDIDAEEFAAAWEQSISEIWKTRIRASASSRPQERPHGMGLDILQAIAISERWTLDARGAYFRERRSESLKNERGYFSASFARVGANFEPSYGTTVGLAYELSVESEVNPRNDSVRRLGTDTLRAAWEQQWDRRWKTRLDLSLGIDSDRQKNSSITGGVVWEL